jgi:hypothetical protein
VTTEDELRQRIGELEAQAAEKDKRLEQWEVAAQRWVQQIDALTRKMVEVCGPGPLKLLDTPRVHRPH